MKWQGQGGVDFVKGFMEEAEILGQFYIYIYIYIYNVSTLMKKNIIMGAWSCVFIIHDCSKNCKIYSKENYPSDV